jgi:alpha-tubulin suppressor-like RCC1 family protein
MRAVLAAAGMAVALTAGTVAPAVAAPAAGQAAQAGRVPRAVLAVPAPHVWNWGGNVFGDLGNGTTNNIHPTPEEMAYAGVRQIAGTGDTTAVVLADGTVAAWGANSTGEIGDGTTTERDLPVIVPGLTGITQIAEGDYVLALDSSGRVWSWGANYYGQLGNGTTSNLNGANPTPVPVPGLTGITQIAAGAHSSFALRSDGTVWAWGDNSDGELGDGTTVNHSSPEQIRALTGVTKIFAGASTDYAIRADGTVLAWGSNNQGMLGIGTATGISTTPVPVPGLTGVTQITSSTYATLALSGQNGAVWGWGPNYHGELGDGTTTAHYTPELTGQSGVAQISAGALETAAISFTGAVYVWGENTYGQLGNGTQDGNSHPSPVQVRALAGATQILAAADHVVAVASPPAGVPSLIGDVQSTAAQELQQAGFVLGRVTTVVDLTCEYIGVVKSQSPVAGTQEPLGTAVSITIGKAGGKCL